jgi:AraC family transcriptional regulator, ethanolamine operon transcriptional activator
MPSTDRISVSKPRSVPQDGFSRGRSEDIDEHAHFVAEVDQRYRQLGTGRFNGSYRLVRLEAVTAFEEFTYPEVVQRGWFEPGLALVFPLHASGEAWFCGQHLQPGQIAVFDGAREFMFRTPSQLQLGVLMLKEEFVSMTFGNGVRPTFGDSIRNTVVRSAAEQRAVGEQFAAVMRIGTLLEANDQPAPGLQRDLLDDLQRLVLSLMPMDDEQIGGRSNARLTHLVVARALDIIHAGVAEGISVYEVCAALQLSRRYLQSCFEGVLGVNPARYILRQRLLAARSLLLKRAGGGATVATAATEYGFWHLGRFAHYYRQMFGESPGCTLAAQRHG